MNQKSFQTAPANQERLKHMKFPYSKPGLKVLGSVEELTKGGQGTKPDGANSTKKK